MHVHEQLLAMITTWMNARPLGLAGPHAPREIPADLLATITSAEPYRTQVIADAREYLALPRMVGVGLIYELVEPLDGEPFEQWDTTISPLTIRLLWSRTMDSGFNEQAYEYVHRVGLEAGQWKIVSLWDATLRKQSLQFLELLGRHRR
jgi:hypothetical protein